MIPVNPHDRRAEYDEDGNIILPSGDDETPQVDSWTVTDEDLTPLKSIEETSGRVSRHQHRTTVPHVEMWEVTDVEEEKQSPMGILVQARDRVFTVTKNIFSEGANQYSWSIDSCRKQCASFVHATLSSKGPLWHFLSQPVWVVNAKKQQMKEYSRLTLFLLDTVRFGGTFAVLFLALFVSLNYQSFGKIAASYVNPIRRVQQSIMSSGSDELKQKLLRSPTLAVAGSDTGDLLSYLPPVGPPNNRIIIPKLSLNVPLVTPSYQALLSEDWENLETDIQDALQMGVVHYPGTARPGQAGNFFVTGHSSYYPWAEGGFKTVFARLHELDVGDEYWVYYGGDKHRYVIQDKREVKPTNVNVLDQPIGKRISTLMTCTPVGTTLRRLIVTAQEVDPTTGAQMEVGESVVRDTPEIKVQTLPI